MPTIAMKMKNQLLKLVSAFCKVLCVAMPCNLSKPNIHGTKEKGRFREVYSLERLYIYSKCREHDLKARPLQREFRITEGWFGEFLQYSCFSVCCVVLMYCSKECAVPYLVHFNP